MHSRTRTFLLVAGVASLALGLAGLVSTFVQGASVWTPRAGGAWAGVGGGLAILVSVYRQREGERKSRASPEATGR